MLLGLVAAPFTGCGPDHKPEQPCDGPTFNLVVTAESGALPADTRVNVRYGSNQEGEAYALGEARTPQAVFCPGIGMVYYMVQGEQSGVKVSQKLELKSFGPRFVAGLQ